jgi:hypothetical protein
VFLRPLVYKKLGCNAEQLEERPTFRRRMRLHLLGAIWKYYLESSGFERQCEAANRENRAMLWA